MASAGSVEATARTWGSIALLAVGLLIVGSCGPNRGDGDDEQPPKDAWGQCLDRLRRSGVHDPISDFVKSRLRPLGPNATSGLEEFLWIRIDGPVAPPQDDDELEKSRPLVFVLVPGGTTTVWADQLRRSDLDDIRNDRADAPRSMSLNVPPFLIGKYELTEGQWDIIAGWPDDRRARPERVNLPVLPSWSEANRVLRGVGLRIPSFAEWSYCATFSTNLDDLRRHSEVLENIAGAETREVREVFEASHEDAFVRHAPVGSFREDLLGLCDVLGNVRERCSDSNLEYFGTYFPDLVTTKEARRLGSGRLVAGGSFLDWADEVTPTFFFFSDEERRSSDEGLRCAMSLGELGPK